jgi:hypothetical protein
VAPFGDVNRPSMTAPLSSSIRYRAPDFTAAIGSEMPRSISAVINGGNLRPDNSASSVGCALLELRGITAGQAEAFQQHFERLFRHALDLLVRVLPLDLETGLGGERLDSAGGFIRRSRGIDGRAHEVFPEALTRRAS